MVEPPKDKSKLRTGFTTGACSAAAAKAATRVLIQQESLHEIEITLPIGRTVVFKLEKCLFNQNEAVCSVIKDAGDDPDCTNGAELTATVAWLKEPGVVLLERGSGVGLVTKPGLGLEVGGPAINPIPRKNITEMVKEAAGPVLETRGLRVVISVPQGEKMSLKTLNARLGIMGGISILGTTGIVVPFSTAAYRASIDQGIDVTLTAGCDHIVLTTGGKSEEFAMKILPVLKEEAFIQMGDFVGHTLKYAAKKRIRKVTICGMSGKMSKIAAGKMMTHAKGSQVDMELLAEIARECGAGNSIVEEIKKANTARHVSELVAQHQITGFFDKVCQKVCEACRKHAAKAFIVECVLTDFDGKLMGRYEIA